MAIHISELFDALNTIYEQQLLISDKLQTLIETFKTEPEPVEPKLVELLQPLNAGMDQMNETLT